MAEVENKHKLLSDKEYNYRDARRRIDELSSDLEQPETQLSKTKTIADKYEYSSTVMAKMIDVHHRRKEKIKLSFTEVKPPFNRNYSIMPNTNKSVDHLLLKSD
ncbi:hypothetical protein R6Q57_019666 [Mikania cordata]